jgi:signal transduction histidine kinase
VTQSRILNGEHEVVGSSLVIRDRRAQNRLEEQMRRSERLAAVSIMAAGLAHEINNPLAILGNRIELMERELGRTDRVDRFRKDLGVLGTHVERIRGLTTDLLAFAREDGDERTCIMLPDVVDRVVRLLGKTFRAKGLELEFTTRGKIPAVNGQENAIETVFVNLLLNAAQATTPGGKVTIELQAQGTEWVACEVRDTGPGVPKQLKARIFEPFFTTKGDEGGTGLGLAVCRTIVERHRGTIRVESDDAGGCFVVEFPTTHESP